MDPLVRYASDSGVATITLDSPANRNALSRQVRSELRAHLAAAMGDDAVRVVVLTHTGTVFCSGMDLRETVGAGDEDQGVRELPELFNTIWTAPKPVIAWLGGTVRAGGMGLAAVCDVVLAADHVTFAFSEVRLGIIPAVISVPLRRLVAPRALHQLLLTGETFDAAYAERIGLVTRAVPASDLEAEVARNAHMLSLGGPTAAAATKRLLRGDPLGVEEELTLSAAQFAGPEAQEGMKAFSERRDPAWVTTQAYERG